MNITHISLYPPKGAKHVSGSGVISYTKNLVTHVNEDNQHVLCDRETRGKSETYREDGLTIHRCFDRGPLFAWQLHQQLKRTRPDVIHIQQELALFGGVLTAYLLQYLVLTWRRKVVITLHGVVDPRTVDREFVRQNNSRLPVWLVRLAFRAIYTPLVRYARQIIVHEAKFKNILQTSYGVAPEKVSVVPHGVEDLHASDQSAARKKLGLKTDANIALFMGYATGYKGLDMLIEGYAEYTRRDPAAYLIIGAGKHPKLKDSAPYLAEYTRLQDKAANLLPKDQYRWAGFIDESAIAKYYSAADVSLYPYTVAMSSSGPMSFAMGFEKPFLASDAFADIFEVYPQLLFRRSPVALADRLAYFFTHQAQYQNISVRLKQQRAWATVGEKTALVYQTVTQTADKEEYAEEKSATTG